MNQYFSAELAQKVKRGMRETRLKGLYQGGGLPYGYKVVNRKIVIDETKAETVKYIFRQYANGVYVREIISSLTKKGILHKGKPFATNTIYGILKNEKYSGVYMHGEEVVDNMYPQLIDKELYKSVRQKVDKNKFGKRSIKVEYLLRNKVKCGYCGKPISADTGTARNGEIKRYYKCIGRKKYNNGCTKTPIRKEDLEECIINVIIQEMSKPEIMDAIVNKLMQLQNAGESANSTLTMLLNEKYGVERSLNNLVNAIENGIVSNTTNKRLQDLEKQQEELERQILVERSKQSIKIPESEIRQFYTQALRDEKRLLVNLLIQEIVLYDDKIETYFKNPTTKSPDDGQGFLFYSGKGKIVIESQNKSPLIIKITIEMYLR